MYNIYNHAKSTKNGFFISSKRFSKITTVILLVLGIIISPYLLLFSHPAIAETNTTKNVIALSSSSPPPSSSNTFSDYVDDVFGYRLQYPSTWFHTFLFGQPAFVLRSVGFSPNLVVTVIPVQQENKSTAQIIAETAKQNPTNTLKRNFTNFQLLSNSITTLGGQPANRIVYTWNLFGNTIEQIAVSTVYNNKRYSLVFSATPSQMPNYVSIAQRIFDSFKLK